MQQVQPYFTDTSMSLFLSTLLRDNLNDILSNNTPVTPEPMPLPTFVPVAGEETSSVVLSLEEIVQPVELLSESHPQVLLSPSDLHCSSESFVAPTLVALLESLQPALEKMARILYHRSSWAMNASLDDLIQEGMIEVWQSFQDYDASKVTHKDAFRHYCLKRARRVMGRMVYLSQRNAISLERYQESAPELAEISSVRRVSSPALKQRIQTAFQEAGLSVRENLVLHAVFCLEDENGDFQTLDELQAHYGCTRDALRYVKLNGLKKLARVLDPLAKPKQVRPKQPRLGLPRTYSRLDIHRDEITDYLKQGMTKAWIARRYEVEHTQLRRWIQRRGIIVT